MPTIAIKGMRCGHCVGAVTEALNKITGVSNAAVNLEKQEATYDAGPEVTPEKIRDAIKAIGFETD